MFINIPVMKLSKKQLKPVWKLVWRYPRTYMLDTLSDQVTNNTRNVVWINVWDMVDHVWNYNDDLLNWEN